MTNAIMSALLNGAIVGALLAGAVRAGLLLAPRRMLTAAARYAVWWAALVAAVLLPLAYLPAPPARHVDVASHLAAPVRQTALTSSPAPAAQGALMLVRRPTPVHLRFPLMLRAGGWLRWIPMAWASLSGLMLLRLLASCILLERLKSGAVAAPEELVRRIEASLARRGSTRRAAMLRSAKVGTPMLAGLWRPAILIPERLFTELTEEELTQVGLHETAHLARRDDYALLVARAIEAVLPFHPVVRWIARQIDLERELACDDFVLESLGVPRRYAACLLRVAELCSGARASWAATGVAGNRSQLTKRVNRLLERNRVTDTRTGKARLFMALGVVAALACLAGRAPGAIALAIPTAAVQPPKVAPTPQTLAASPKPMPPTDVEPRAFDESFPNHILYSGEVKGTGGKLSLWKHAFIADVAAAAPQTPAPVLLTLTVQDIANRHVAGLTKENFQLFEDGVEQRIAEVSVDNPPLSVEIIVDMSGSMRDKQALVDAAVMQLVKSANPADEFLLVTFTDHVDEAGPFGNDPGQILNQLHFDPPRGGTALRDAIIRAVEWKTARYPDRIMVVISDGDDNSSSVRIEELRDAVFAARTPIWAITLASPATYPGRESLWLRDMAEQSLGHEFVSGDPGQVADAAASVANQIRYVLKYNSTNQALDGKYRRVKVDVVTTPPGTFKIAAPMGYYPTGR
jgi:Ca-activated chloride channel homolog